MNNLITIMIASAMAMLIAVTVTLGRDVVFDDRAHIKVNDLQFTYDPVDGPSVRQSRAVRGRTVVYGVWEASIKRKDTNEIVCSGEGFWPYSVGNFAPVLPIDVWVGDRGCWERLPNYIQLQACAQYYVADNAPSTACSLSFTKTDEEDPAPLTLEKENDQL